MNNKMTIPLFAKIISLLVFFTVNLFPVTNSPGLILSILTAHIRFKYQLSFFSQGTLLNFDL